MKILIIEDETDLANNISIFLDKENFISTIASSGQLAKQYIIGNGYDCILLDIGLPDANGLDILKLLKERKDECGVIIISAKDSLDDKLIGLDLGADDYITKPFHLSELNSRLKSVLRRRKFSGNKEKEFSIRLNGEFGTANTFLNSVMDNPV